MLTRLYLAIASVLTGEPMLQPATSRARRGAINIEYMLLAAIAVALFWIFRSQLTGVFSNVLERISSALNF